jgi:hypothetical protein
MTRTLNVPAFESTAFEQNSTFNVLIAYQDLETGKQAKSTYDFLVERLGAECQFTSQMWKFDVMTIPYLRELAVKDASKADIIIIACHGGALPFEVKAWIELWLAEQHRPSALVAMFDEQGYCNSEVRGYLADVAKRGGMEFFAQPDGSNAQGKADELFRTQIPDAFGKYNFSVAPGLMEPDRSFPRWGINE